ncbi:MULTISPECIES: hypothetical protein [Vibrio]|uniref:hypothetical protein n=1 Tax=Vibrio TaxID=662 RepID=UPI000B5C8E31|nr:MULTISPECIES: hypothetical protein [Vibrio]HBV76941.1 hypothetical protein [Vibrio sp.]
MQITDKACAIYCQQLPSAHNNLVIIQALLNGLSAEEILKANLTPNLSPRTVLVYCDRLKGVIANATKH